MAGFEGLWRDAMTRGNRLELDFLIPKSIPRTPSILRENTSTHMGPKDPFISCHPLFSFELWPKSHTNTQD